MHKKINKFKVKKEDIIKILMKFGSVKPNIKNSYNFVESGFIDSLNLLNFITDVEKKYRIVLDHNYTSSPKFGEIRNLVKKINQLKNKKNNSSKQE